MSDIKKDGLENRLGFIFHFCAALYLGLWYSSIVPSLLQSGAFSYQSAGWAGLLLLTVVAINVYFGKSLPKLVLALFVFSSIGLFYLTVLLSLFSVIYLLSAFHGLIVGYILLSSLKSQQTKTYAPFWILGIASSLAFQYFSLEHSYTKVENSISIEGSFNIGFLISIVFVSTILAILLFKQKPVAETVRSNHIQRNTNKVSTTLGYLITAILVILEISFIFWSMVLRDKSQSWMYQLTFPLTLLLIFLFRQYFHKVFSKHFNIGWLFVCAIMITVSLGLFYTFDFTLMFIIFFSFFMAFAAQASIHIFSQVWDKNKIALLMLSIAIMMGIAGLYIQNHIEFIDSIKMPENVMHLSAKQAWIKELAAISGLLIIFSGIVFLKRRTWMPAHVVMIAFVLISASSCKNSASNHKLFAVITQYEAFQNHIDTLNKDTWGIETDSIRMLKMDMYTALMAQITTLDTLKITTDDFINKDLMLLEMENELNDITFQSHLLPLNSEGGFLTNIVYSIQYASPKSKEDYIKYLQKLKDLPAFIQHHQKVMEVGIKNDKTSPTIITQRCIDLTVPFQNIDANDNIFIAPLAGNDSLFQIAKTLVKGKIEPAYVSFATFLKDTYLPASQAVPGISQLKDGKKYYEGKVKYFTTLNMTPEQVFDTGEKEAARIKSEMETIIKSLNFRGSFSDFIAYLRKDPQFYAKTPRELLYRATWLSKKIEGKLPKYFNKLPRMPFTVEEVSPSIAPNYTSGRYSEGNYETGKPGAYWVNTYKLESRPLYALPALTLHEAVPGHHLQIMLSQEMENVPEFRQNLYISAFGEGWGLYSEYLGKEAEMYETPYEDFGRLTYEMWRACRLVVDVGLHYKGWTQDQAINYMSSNTALSMHEVNTEIDRYIGWPAQAVSYKIGEIKIRQLRKITEEKLGTKFDIKAFHDMVLANGSVRLNTLERIVNQYIIEELSKKDKN
jgi:uncharacterized protein (DUF885 family)